VVEGESEDEVVAIDVSSSHSLFLIPRLALPSPSHRLLSVVLSIRRRIDFNKYSISIPRLLLFTSSWVLPGAVRYPVPST
jgi:hypothetical protein